MKRKPQSDTTTASGDGSNSREEEMLIPKNKRPREDEEDNINENKIPPPKYGTKEYWEARYKSHLPGMHMDETSCTLDGVVLSKDATKPGHEWYFTYDELRPLIIPLILGTLDNTVAEGDYDDEDEDAESWIEEEEEEEEEEVIMKIMKLRMIMIPLNNKQTAMMKTVHNISLRKRIPLNYQEQLTWPTLHQRKY